VTFRVRMIVQNPLGYGGYDALWSDGSTREVTTCFAGCVDADDARMKATQQYAVVLFKTIEPVEGAQ